MAFRQRLLEATGQIAITIASGLKSLQPDQQALLAKALKERQHEFQKKSEDCEYVPKLKSVNLSDFETVRFGDGAQHGLIFPLPPRPLPFCLPQHRLD